MSSLTSDHRPLPPGPVGPRRGTGSWRWVCATEAGVAVDGPPLRFATQDAAQHWLDRHADALLRQHIAWVTLSDGERVVGGPLSLR